MQNFSENEKQILSSNNSNIIIKRNGKKYYIKEDPYYYEIIGEYFAKYIGLDSFHYEPFTYNNHNYVASPDIASRGTFETLYKYENLINHRVTLYDLWNIIDSYYPNKKDEMKYDITKMYLMDLLLMNCDRDLVNIGILDNDHIISFDNKEIFSNQPSSITCDLNFKTNKRYKEMKLFINNASIEYIELFKDIISIMTPEEFKKLIIIIEDVYNITIENKKTILAKYNYTYNYANKLLSNMKVL